MHLAAQQGDTAVVQALLQAQADLNATDADGWTPLHFAADAGHAAGQARAGAQADVNAANAHGQTPMCCAAAGGHTDAVQLLLAAGS